MSSAVARLFNARLDYWSSHPCPFCGQLPDPWWLGIASAYTFSCRSCDEVIEAFDLCADDWGHAYLENHLLPVPSDPPTP